MDRIFRVEVEGRPRYAVEVGREWRLIEGDLFERFSLGPPLESAARAVGASEPPRLLPPVVPSKIVAVGLNYRDHAREMNKPLPAEPLIFLKPPSAVIGPGDRIRIPPGVGRVDYEAELGVVIGRRASRVPARQAADYVLGLVCLNDVTARDLQRRDGQYTRCKGFDTFAPIGPCIARGLDARELAVEGWLNGERRQASNTRELIFPIPDLVEFVSSIMTLQPGDVIATGTPSGVGPLAPGDRVTVKVEGVGELVNEVERE